MKKRVIDILTNEEYHTIQRLIEGLKRSPNNTQVFYYKRAIDRMIEKAKERYYKAK